MCSDLGKVLALELYTAAQALDYRRDMINAARRLASEGDVEALAAKVAGAAAGGADREGFLAEVGSLRAELAASPEFQPGRAVRAAHKTLRRYIKFMGADRAMDGDVAMAVRLVEEGTVLRAARDAL
jgi:histidine ammonia-lyase